MAHNGFDAVVGNPPFLGGKRISSEHGTEYEKFLKVAFDAKGAGDLSCYFFRRGYSILNARTGVVGLLATNSITEGDSPGVGLSPIIANGGIIYRARKSFQWPGKAGVFVSVVHLIKGNYSGSKFLDNNLVSFINSQLHTDTTQKPYKLISRLCLASAGRQLYGNGFILENEMAHNLLEDNENSRSIIKPYINSEILSSAIGATNFSTYAIDFGEMSEFEASKFSTPFNHVKKYVKPLRDLQTKQIHEDRFWIYWDKRSKFFQEVGNRKLILVCGLHTAYLSFVFLSPSYVLTHALQLFCSDQFCDFGLLQSSIFEVWARKYSSSIGQVLRFSSSDAFDTFPIPKDLTSLDHTGQQLYQVRHELMMSRSLGLTDTYNCLHDPSEKSADIEFLRSSHLNLDQSVATAFGWMDLDLDHGFHETKQGIRYTISEAARREVLDRLLALNHQRHEEEEAAKMTMPVSVSAKRGRKPKDNSGQITLDL